MAAEQVIVRARELKASSGVKCSKFAGAVGVELVRAALAGMGIPTSARDVFVRGVPVEVDLIIPHRAQELLGVLYEPHRVAAALEVKNSGSFGEATIQKVRSDFGRLREAGIACAYLWRDKGNRRSLSKLRCRDGKEIFSPVQGLWLA